MKATKRAPTVNLNLAKAIEEVVGKWNLETQGAIIHIASLESEIMEGTACNEDVIANVESEYFVFTNK